MKYIGLILLVPLVAVFVVLGKQEKEQETALRQAVEAEIQQQDDKLKAVVEQNKRETDAMRLELLQQTRGVAVVRAELDRAKAEVARLEAEKTRLAGLCESMRQQSGEISKSQAAVVNERENTLRDKTMLEGQVAVLEEGLATLADANPKPAANK